MSRYLRLSEKWFRRGLWLVGFIFAGFLIGLGGTVVNDLPRAGQSLTLEDFVDQGQATPLRQKLKAESIVQTAALKKLGDLEVQVGDAQRISDNARETFDNWVRTRAATQRPEQDAELIARTKALEALKAKVNERQDEYAVQLAVVRALNETEVGLQAQLSVLTAAAEERFVDAQRRVERRVFLYRLALTLPLLLVAAWLFVKKRQGKYWPFVWGFILFSLFAFFVELVPYLPSYGGYVRYTVGILLTLLIGRYAINALNHYLAQQRQAEAQPETQRRQTLSYDVAMARFGKGVCPGCERVVALGHPEVDYCAHCGMNLFDECAGCHSRKNAFSPYCHHCGVAAHSGPIQKTE